MSDGIPPDAQAQGRWLRHELRTPLNHILGFAALLLEEVQDQGELSWVVDLRRIDEAGRASLDLVNDLVADGETGASNDAVAERLCAALAEIAAICARLASDAESRGERDALADLARIGEAAAHLIDTVTHRLARPASAPDGALSPPVQDPSPAAVVNGTVLVVDDDPGNRDLLARWLERLGCTAMTAAGGRQALDLLGAAPCDLVLLDVMMPEMDGFAVLGRLKADPRLRELPVIVLSAMDETAAAVRCITLGADDYLPKPFDPVLLRARIGACLEKKRLRDREITWLRQAAQVTGPAIIAHLLVSPPIDPTEEGEDAALRAAIDAASDRVWLGKSEALFTAGDAAGAMYALRSGRLQVRMEDENGAVRIAGEVHAGEPVGELEMLTGRPRTATVIAVRDAELACLSREQFIRLTQTFPRLLTRTTDDVIGRLRAAFQRSPAGATVTTIALAPVSPSVPIGDLARELSDALGAIAPTLHLDAGRLTARFGTETGDLLQDGADSPRLAAWLNDLELRYRYVIYEAEPSLTGWTRRCLRQADRLLLVGSGAPERIDPELEAAFREACAATPAELILVHNDTRAAGTAAWLDRWPARMHHHLRPGAAGSVQRLVRHLTGQSIGLVLSGGGARGWAHIGVIRALDEAGVPIDAIGGASMGALLGGTSAIGHSWREVIELGQMLSSPRSLFDYTLPMVSIFSGRKLMRMLQTTCGDWQIEDLPRPFFCVSSSLTRAELIVHRRGPLWRAVRESISLPGIFPPFARGGDLRIDGAYLNNLPIDIMRELYGDGTVIAVNANPREDAEEVGDIGPVVSGWNVLWRQLAPWTRPVPAPSIAAMIVRSSSLNGSYRLAASERLADLALSPPVAQFGVLDFGAYERIIAIGYEDAQRQIAAWQERQTAASPVVAPEGDPGMNSGAEPTKPLRG